MLMRSVATLITMSAALGGCKSSKPLSSSGKSLDNFAAGTTLSDNRCGMNPDASGYAVQLKAEESLLSSPSHFNAELSVTASSESEATRTAAARALTSVPKDIKSFFFTSLRGQILITDNVKLKEKCLKVFDDQTSSSYVPSAQRPKDLKACFAPILTSQGQFDRVQMIFVPEPDAIAANLVRMFGYIEAQMVPRIIIDPNGQVALVLNDSLPNFKVARTKMADIFIFDSARLFLSSNGKLDLKGLDAFFGDETGKRLVKNYSEGGQAFDGISPNADDPTRRRFADFVYAEAFDSYFCKSYGKSDQQQPNTKLQMEEMFGGSFRNFNAVRSGVEQYLAANHETPKLPLTNLLLDETPSRWDYEQNSVNGRMLAQEGGFFREVAAAVPLTSAGYRESTAQWYEFPQTNATGVANFAGSILKVPGALAGASANQMGFTGTGNFIHSVNDSVMGAIPRTVDNVLHPVDTLGRYAGAVGGWIWGP